MEENEIILSRSDAAALLRFLQAAETDIDEPPTSATELADLLAAALSDDTGATLTLTLEPAE